MDNKEVIKVSRNYCGLKEKVVELIRQFRSVLYPNIFGTAGASGVTREALEMHARESLKEILPYFEPDKEKHDVITKELAATFPAIKKTLDTDVIAAYRGDPAALSYDEVMLSYPFFEALTIFRVAHKLYELDVKILPRMMTEYAHSITGIDIHPGATIGDYFFIDHGTGVVIGETAVIGDNVKVFQGVTIGAKSFKHDEEGNIIKGMKRHPNIGNNVVIYAGATILGGDTTIGDGSVIGGNVWLTESVDANSTVLAANNEVKHL